MPTPDEKEIQILRDSEEKYRKMIERANDAIFSIDLASGNIVEVNPKAEEMTGYSQSELVGMNVEALHPPEEFEKARKLFDRVSSTGRGMCTGVHLLTKTQGMVPIDISASVISYGNRKIIQRICRDASEREAIQEEREARRAFFEFVLNMLPVGLGVRRDINTKPTIEFENSKLKEMFAGDPDDPDYCGWCDQPEDLPTKAILDDTGVYAEERRYPNGKVYQFTIGYYRDGDNSWSELQLIRDVTLRRRLEDEVQEAKADLERKVEERTRELRDKQTQLVQSEKMAALGHLVAGVAHEINTPLGALKSNNDLLVRSMAKLRTSFADESASAATGEVIDLKKLLNAIDGLNQVNTTAMGRIVTLVSSLRKFARLDQAEQDTVDIHDGLESTLTLVHHELKTRITIHKDYSQLPQINVYPNQINQVFMNVLVNAGQAIADKGDIYIRTYQRDGFIVVEFRDTGKGISEENLARIFDPGFTTKGAGVGTGLGLSIVYQIIRDHEGDIEVESEIGKGATIRILLPIR